MNSTTQIVIGLCIIVVAVSAVLGFTAMRLGRSTFSINGKGAHQPFAGILPSIEIKGELKGLRTGDGKTMPYHVETILVPIVTYAASPIQLSNDSMTITYTDTRQKVNDLPWSAHWIRGNAANDLLNVGELVEITLQVAHLSHPLIESTHFTLEFKPLDREPKIVKRATPASLDPIIIFGRYPDLLPPRTYLSRSYFQGDIAKMPQIRTRSSNESDVDAR